MMSAAKATADAFVSGFRLQTKIELIKFFGETQQQQAHIAVFMRWTMFHSEIESVTAAAPIRPSTENGGIYLNRWDLLGNALAD